MKILFPVRLWYPHVGGVEKHVFKLAEKLNKLHKVTVITEQHDQRLPEYELVNGVQVYRIPLSNNEASKKWIIWKWISSHAFLLDDSDIIHAHDVFYWLYMYKIMRPQKPVYVTFHGWEGKYPIPIKNIIHKKIASALSKGTICVGEFIAKWYGVKPDLVTYGATDIFDSDSIAPAHNTLLFVGRLDVDTGFEACIKKYNSLKAKMKWKLAVAGDGPLRHLVPGEAQYLGVVNDIDKHIASAKYIFATGYLSILESFARKKVVLAHYDNPVKKDYLIMHPQAKYLFFGDDFPEVLPEEPYRWAREQTWEKLANQYLELWKR